MKELAPVRIMAVLLLALALLGGQALLPSATMDRLSWSALADATMTFQPAAPAIAIGGEVWVAIRINNVQDLTAADVRLSFDRTVVQVLDADGVSGDPVGLQKGTMPYPDLVLRNEANNGLGEIWYVTTQLAPRAPATGSGTLATIHLRGLRDGSTTIYFTNHDLAGDQGYVVPHTVGACTVRVGSGVATLTATPLATLTATPSHTITQTATRTGTPTVTATPSHTPTASLTPTPGPSPTSTSSPTITQTPTQTTTALPSPTASQTPTITATPIAAQRTFSGAVYAGAKGNRSVPLPGVEIKLWGAWVAGTHGFYLTKTNTDYQGRFSLTYTASYPHYSVIESDPAGYQSAGAFAGPGGFVLDQPEGNWVEFRDTSAGEYPGTEFFDLPAESTSTPTPSVTPGGATLTPTAGTPTATGEPSGLPIYVSERALADTFVNSREPDVMNGRLGHLHLGMSAQGPHKNALVWFDLSDIPVGSSVREATLFLFGRDVDSTIPLCAEGLLADWQEYQATWQQPADGLSWDQQGALGSGDADGQCVSGAFKDAGRVQYYEWNVGPLVNAWLQGQRPNQGFMIHIQRGTKAKETHGLYSREYSETALRPMLSVVFWEPTATPTPTMTATATPSPTPTGEPRLVLPLVLRGTQ